MLMLTGAVQVHGGTISNQMLSVRPNKTPGSDSVMCDAEGGCTVHDGQKSDVGHAAMDRQQSLHVKHLTMLKLAVRGLCIVRLNHMSSSIIVIIYAGHHCAYRSVHTIAGGSAGLHMHSRIALIIDLS